MGADFLARSGLGDDLNYVPVDKHTLLSKAYDNVFALGTPRTSRHRRPARSRTSRSSCSPTTSSLIDGKPMTRSFDGHANCFIESGTARRC